MTALINMPRAAWKRQPQGALEAHPGWMNQSLSLLSTRDFMLNTADHRLATYTYTSGTRTTVAYQSMIGTLGDGANSFSYSNKEVFGNGEITAIFMGLPSSSMGASYAVNQTNGTNNCAFGANFNDQFTGTGASGRLSLTLLQSGVNRSHIYAASAIDGTLSCYAIRKKPGAHQCFKNGILLTTTTSGTLTGSPSGSTDTTYVSGVPTNGAFDFNAGLFLVAVFKKGLTDTEIISLTQNPWQLFAPTPSRFYLIPSGGGGSSVTASFSIDALIQRAGLTHSTTIDALLQSAFSRSLSIDGLIAAVQTGMISMDALLQIVGTRTVSMDALLQATKTGTVSVDAMVQMTLAQSISLDAMIVAASASSASVSMDALIQSLKTAGLSVDALLSKSISAAAVMDALIQASKTGAVSLDAIITGASSASIFVGLDALIQAVQSRTLSVDALLQKAYTNTLSLDAYVALTRVQPVSLDALIQASKTGLISLDALIQMTRTASISFDALIQAAKAGAISLDAILVFATQASVLLDAYVQKTLSAGIGLDAIIGAIADMILPTGRVVSIPSSDRWVLVTHADRFIQIQ